jgi:hypothetical protein
MESRTETREAEALREQLRRAEIDLQQSLQHFQVLRRAAFSGRYDSEAFDLAILACRAARAARQAAWNAARTAPGPNPPGPAAPPHRAPSPLARLRFARWLVETGRLSDLVAS